jgi:hypothetical protein
MTRTFGTGLLTPADLTILAFMRPAVANQDLRCMPMPHQLDALKMGQEMERVASWPAGRHRFFHDSRPDDLVLDRADAVAQFRGRGQGRAVAHQPGPRAVRQPGRPAAHPAPNRPAGHRAIGFGFVVTTLLTAARNYFTGWPFHPVGYAIANTNTMTTTWMPFFLAWLFKTLALRYGGARFYRASLPFFLGLIAGDLIGGGLFTALGGITGHQRLSHQLVSSADGSTTQTNAVCFPATPATTQSEDRERRWKRPANLSRSRSARVLLAARPRRSAMAHLGRGDTGRVRARTGSLHHGHAAANDHAAGQPAANARLEKPAGGHRAGRKRTLFIRAVAG